MIQNCGLVYSIDRKKLRSEYSYSYSQLARDQMFISGEMVAIPNNFCCTTIKNDSFSIEIVKAYNFMQLVYAIIIRITIRSNIQMNVNNKL